MTSDAADRPPARPPVVVIESLASGGNGVARLPEGMTVFVPRTAPGDRVALTNIRKKRRFATASIGAIESPGPDRVAPPCPHYANDRCGGCQWQHIAPQAQRAAKSRIIGDALRRLGRLDVADPAVTAGPRDLHYRSTITLAVRGTASRTIAGFHDFEQPSVVFHLQQCFIAREEVDALWQQARHVLDALPSGDDVRLKLRAQDGRHLIVEGGDRAWSREAADRVARAVPGTSVWWKPTGGAARRMAGAEADAGAASFAQVNPEVAGMLREAVGRAVGRSETAGRRVLDLYAGIGDTAIPLARQGDDVVMVESDERAVQLAEARVAAAGVKLRAIAAKVEDVLAGLLPANVVIVNPPRTGLGDVVTDRLTARPPDRLVYVSCDPATLARDLARLTAAGMRIADLTAFDMFPQTSHVETLAVLDRAAT